MLQLKPIRADGLLGKHTAEYLVRVRWLKTVAENTAIKENGLFGNQNTVARPKDKRWNHTVERLKARVRVPKLV